jgi:transketolase
LPDFTGKEAIATRATSERVINAISPKISSFLGGSADLTGSNNTKAAEAKPITSDDFSGSYVYYGVREHGMGAIMNGLATHKIRAFGGTFLSFADYMRPAIRTAALMGLPVIYVFTHDSIGLGEDGPTHQPVEHLASLRIIPNLVTIRPADGNETSRAWQVALERKNGPTCLILSRQALPQVAPYENDLSKGAYILAEVENGKPDIIIIASGSEITLALETKKELVDAGIQARVVSMPSWELYNAQDAVYKKSIVLPGIPCLAIEAGSTFGWDKYLGQTSDKIGVDRFGASAPGPEIFRQFGFTVENAVKKVRQLMQ